MIKWKSLKLVKKYRFNLTIALKDNHIKASYESRHFKCWMDYCDGKQVVVTGALDGTIASPFKIYEIAPWWCEEIK